MPYSVIPADQDIAVAAALFAIAVFGFWAENQAWGKLVTGAVWAILAAIIAANIGLIPKSAAAYDFVFQYLVPALVPLFLIHADVKKILVESGRVGIAFILACMGTALGAIAGFLLLDLGAKEADLAGIFTATYTGGSVNYAAVIQSTGFDDATLISAATAVDNLMSALFLAILAAMPASNWLMSKFSQRDFSEHDSNTAKPHVLGSTNKITAGMSSYSLAAAITFALVVVALSDFFVAALNELVPSFDFSRLRYVFITVFSIIPATIAPRKMDHMEGGQTLGIVLAFVFFAAIAAGADLSKLLNNAPILLLFVTILLTIHWLVLFGLGKCFNFIAVTFTKKKHEHVMALSLPELITASNAAILGATTAPALAMARGWPALATPGILVGVAGYIIGTPLGIFIAAILS